MSPIRVVYVDDEQSDRKMAVTIQELLQRDGQFSVDLVRPPMHLDDLLRWRSQYQPELFLIDYDLSSPDDGFEKPGYHGTTLASEVREVFSDFPIVIISQGTLTGENPTLRRRLEAPNPVFDELLLKDDLIKRRQLVVDNLFSLAEGYQKMRSDDVEKSWGGLLAVLDAREEESGAIREASVPFNDHKWEINDIARWIRHVLLRFPGILMDEARAAAFLGISLKSFQREYIQNYISSARYSGVLQMASGHWWQERLAAIAVSLIRKVNKRGSIAEHFGDALQADADAQKESVLIFPSTCVWDKSSHANMLCHVLQKPVQVRNSLRYFPDSRPSVMEPARVSFRAIRESENFGVSPENLEREGRDLINRIRELEDPAPGWDQGDPGDV